MQPAVELREATLHDVVELALNLREADRQELWAVGHDDPVKPILEGVLHSDWSKAALVDGEVVCIFGLANQRTVLTAAGIPWMLGTPLVAQHARVFMQMSRAYIAQMLREYDQLFNVVHAPNHLAKGWLRRMGFQLEPARPLGPHGELFHVFRMTRHV